MDQWIELPRVDANGEPDNRVVLLNLSNNLPIYVSSNKASDKWIEVCIGDGERFRISHESYAALRANMRIPLKE